MQQLLVLVYGITNGDGSGYNRIAQFASTKSKVGETIQMENTVAIKLKQVPEGYLVVGGRPTLLSHCVISAG